MQGEETNQEQSQNEETQEQAQEAPEQDSAESPEGEAPPEDTEAKADDAEGEESEGEEQKPEETEGKPKHRRKGGWERTIERQEREIEFLRSQPDGRMSPAQQAQTQQPQQPAKDVPPEEKAVQFVQGLVQQTIAAEKAREAQERQARELQESEKKAAAKYEDYGDVLNRFARSRVPQSHLQAILTSAEAPEIMYTVAKDPEALARFASLPPAQAYLEVGRLEAKLASSTATPANPKPVTRLPPPPPTVGGSTKSTRDVVDLPIAEYKRRFRSGR